MKKYELIVENEACWGCKACEAACMQEYNFNARYLRLGEEGALEDGAPNFMYKINVCKQCEDPICATACPERAIYKKENGLSIVYHDKEKCNGCHATAGKSGAEKENTSPCKFNCPAMNNVQGFVSLAGRGRFEDALQLIHETSPFPSICGRVCHHPCESECRRRDIDQPVSIQAVERFIADYNATASAKPFVPSTQPAKQEKVAIIGSGPAGLSAAFFLAKEGYRSTVFEKMPVAGGMLSLAIPEYRLPRDIIAREVDQIKKMGVEIKTNTAFGKDVTLQSLKNDGYKAVFIATGLHENRGLGVAQEDAKGVLRGIDFLRDVALGKSVSVGAKVVVVGGGNVAVDVALTALRKGGKDVSIVCLEDINQMPAWDYQIKEAKEEGIKIINCFGPDRFIEKNGKVAEVEFKRCTCVLNEDGNFDPKYDKKDMRVMEADTVIVAIGQAGDLSFAKSAGIAVAPTGRITADPHTLQTSVAGVFVGGDVHHGPKSVIEAIAAGRAAAVSIRRYIQGEHLWKGRERQYKKIANPVVEHYDHAQRALVYRTAPKDRVNNFKEVQAGLEQNIAIQEGLRCIACGTSCSQSCPYEAISFDEKSGKAAKCNLCYERVENGLYPACADNICLAHCVYFGDPAEIRKTIDQKRAKRQCLY